MKYSIEFEEKINQYNSLLYRKKSKVTNTYVHGLCGADDRTSTLALSIGTLQRNAAQNTNIYIYIKKSNEICMLVHIITNFFYIYLIFSTLDMYCDAFVLGQCRSSLMKTMMSRCFGK
jgi:hypothetical protein